MVLQPFLPLRNENANLFRPFPGTSDSTTFGRESRPISTENRLRTLNPISLIAVARALRNLE